MPRQVAPGAAEDHLRVETLTLAHTVVVRAAGSIDIDSVAVWRDELMRALASDRHRVVIDLDECDFIDSVGLGVLAGFKRRAAHAGRSLIVATEQTDLLHVLRVTGLDQVLTIRTDRARLHGPGSHIPTQLSRQPGTRTDADE